MPLKLKFFFSWKKATVLVLIIGLGIYLNRSYAHIFDYDKSRGIVSADIQRDYILKNGQGKDKIEYIALGDSLTYGFGAQDYKGTYPYVIARKLLKNYSEVKVLDLAVSGAVTDEVLNYQLPQALKEKPNFVTVMTGTNDVHDYVDPEKFKDELKEIVQKLKSTNAQVLVINIPYLGTRDLILPPHNFIMDQRIKQFNKIIKDVTDQERVGYFDLYSVSKKPFEENPQKYYSIDKFHPSSEGYLLWGEFINVN